MGKTALIAGVSGITGFSLASRLLSEGWKVYGISRRTAENLPPAINHLLIDLTNEDNCKTGLAPLNDVTHVYITLWVNRISEDENCKVNSAIVSNFLDNLSACKLEHVLLETGTKHYYLRPYEKHATIKDSDHQTPFKECQPRLPYPNFYYNQEDVLFDRAEKRGFKWNVARPNIIIGFSPNSQANLGMSLAVYASICKHLDLPFIFPGTAETYDLFADASDADLIAKHIIWEVTDTKAANEAFNIVNGDVFRWRWMWQTIADYFGVQVGEPKGSHDIVNMMAEKGPVWKEIVEKHGLKSYKIEDFINWPVLPWFFSYINFSSLSDMNKSREFGFKDTQDTEQAFKKLFDFLRQSKYIP